jgi:hypothetical protein
LRASATNLFGSWVDLSVQTREEWSREEDQLILARDFVHPNVRLVGGVGVFNTVDKINPQLPPGTFLETQAIDPWLGWGFRLSDGDVYGRRRFRLIPAVRVQYVDYLAPPRQYAETENQWRDWRRYLGQITVVGVDHYTTSLVNSYGETEDIPSGTWVGLMGGFENAELRDRYYHGARILIPRFTERESFVVLGAGFGGFRRGGHFEDGVLNLLVGGFSPLHKRRSGDWRHFYTIEYMLGINRGNANRLRLDEYALRDLDSDQVAGDQRLTARYEGVLFTRLSILGFRAATFGYAAGGFIGDSESPVFDERFSLNLGLGLRLNNPRLAIPTMELRAGFLSTPAGTEPAITFRMGDVELLRRSTPSVVPEIVPYR